MTEVREVYCDNCTKDLRFTGYNSEYRLALVPQPMGHRGGTVFSMNVPCFIQNDKHFCSIKCLKEWLEDSE